MIESLCLAGMLFGNLWGPVMSDAEKTPVTGPAAAVPPCDRPEPPPPPLKPVALPSCDEPPDLQNILRALPSMPRGLPYIYDVFRDDIEVSAEKLVDGVDPPCFFPLIGLAQMHHGHWKCTVTFTEHIDVAFPCPFQIKRRRSEVVYIDKDDLRLCMASNSDDGPNANSGSCPGGHFRSKEAPTSAGKSNPEVGRIANPSCSGEKAQQVQLEVVVAHIKKSALTKVAFPWSKNQNGSAGAISFGVVKNREELLGQLHTLRSEGLAKILAEPRLNTVSGQTGSILSAGEVPIATSAGPGAPSVTYQNVGTEIRILPIVKANGKILLEVRTVTTALDSALPTKTPPGFKTKSANVMADIEAGQTLAMGALTLNDEHERVILVTPWVVNATPGTAAPPVVQIRRTEECPRSFQTVRSTKADRDRAMTIDDVVKMSQRGISSHIILRQIELTNAVFNLTADDIIYLHDQGVCDDIISAMQERRTGAAIVQPLEPR
jgi:hypothetical protein